MNKRRLLLRAVPIVIAVIYVAFQYFSAEKFTNDAGRTARVALSPEQEAELGFQSYAQVISKSQPVESGAEYELVKRVAARLAGATGGAAKNFDWRVALVRDAQVNAFCLPGGKIVVFTGILPVAKSEAGLATVMGHEMAHATARHGSERIFQQKATQTLMTGVQFSLGDMSYEQQRAIMGAIGAGAKYGVLLLRRLNMRHLTVFTPSGFSQRYARCLIAGVIMPFGRDHESEADRLGLLYMARAGYDPREAVAFWQRMEEASGSGAPPEFLSTHPSHGTRVEQLQALMPEALEEYRRKVGR